MPNYAGRFVQQMWTKNFGGIDSKATILNIKDNEAADITNFNIGIDGSITRRDGYTAVAFTGFTVAPTEILYWAPFYDEDGFKHYLMIGTGTDADGVSHNVWDSDLPEGPYTGRGTVTFTLGIADAYKFIVANWKGSVIVGNGTDAPVYYKYGETATTLKEASKIKDPTALVVVKVGAGPLSDIYSYAVSAYTPRGETRTASFCGGVNPTAPISASNYALLSWEPVLGASGYRIYWLSTDAAKYTSRGFDGAGPGANTWVQIAELPNTTLSYGDDAVAIGSAFMFNGGKGWYSPQTISAAYRMPSDWEDHGYPHGFTVIARGRDERLMSWRGQYVWVSAQSVPIDFMAEGDSFVFNIDGGLDRDITSISTLYDYTLVFTKSQCFIYTGSSADTITLEKMIGRGCTSHKSVVSIEGDLYFWSDYGPTSFKRIMAGADISSSTDFNKRIQNLIFDSTNPEYWNRICCFRFIPDNRVVWAVPAVGETLNSIGIVFQFDVNAWSKYDNWRFQHCLVDDNYTVYGVSEASGGTNYLAEIYYGTSDNGTAIEASYKTGWFDMRSWETRKRLVWSDVVVDRAVGNYTFQTKWAWDYDREISSPITCTETTTDGSTIESTSSNASVHRVFADGIGNAFQLVFTTSSSTPLKILGWRPEIRGRGVRQ